MIIDPGYVVAIIPARSGSTRIPGKNMKEFHGKPIIQYSIEKALESQLFCEVVVSTDSHETVALAESLGVTGEYRYKNLCHNDVGTQEVARSVIQNSRLGKSLACVIYATAPMMRVSDLKAAMNKLADNEGVDYVYSVGSDGKDAGQFYWCRSIALISNKPLDDGTTLHHVVPDHCVCDINTPEDWDRALRMYEGGL